MTEYSMRSPNVRRILQEAKELSTPCDQYYAQPMDNNIFEWHFTIRGAEDTPFYGGLYHGRISLPNDYPFKPPSIMLLTPNGRFEVNKKICLSISDYHPEHWQPSWSIRTVLLALISFMPTEGKGAIGALDCTAHERKRLAALSVSWQCDFCKKMNKQILTAINVMTPPTLPSHQNQQEQQQQQSLEDTLALATDATSPDDHLISNAEQNVNAPTQSSQLDDPLSSLMELRNGTTTIMKGMAGAENGNLAPGSALSEKIDVGNATSASMGSPIKTQRSVHTSHDITSASCSNVAIGTTVIPAHQNNSKENAQMIPNSTSIHTLSCTQASSANAIPPTSPPNKTVASSSGIIGATNTTTTISAQHSNSSSSSQSISQSNASSIQNNSTQPNQLQQNRLLLQGQQRPQPIRRNSSSAIDTLIFIVVTLLAFLLMNKFGANTK